jgi:hypothetical protein
VCRIAHLALVVGEQGVQVERVGPGKSGVWHEKARQGDEAEEPITQALISR